MKQHFMYSEGGGYKPKVVANPEEIEFLIIDLFCGAGGTTTGFDQAQLDGKKCALVVACINHDPKAIESHWLNHPEVVHFEEDIRTLELSPLVELLLKYRLLYPNAKVILWASLECTNFSKAKGGQPRDADSRTLADHLDRYIIALQPDYIQIENVVEFMSWGPLDANGKPVSKRSGSDWLRWREHINSFGYRDEWREMNSADFGAYTSRNRLFGCFAKHGLPIIWPEPTHSKKPGNKGLFGGLEKWKAVKDVLDFEDEGQSILSRKNRLSPKTLERIYAGLIKYVAGGKDKFMQQIYATASNSSGNYDLDRPARTVTTRDASAIVSACFLQKHFSGKPDGKVIPVTGPAGTLTTSANQSLIQPKFIVQRNGGNPDGRIVSVNGPARTITGTGGNQDLVQPTFMMNYHHSSDVNSIENPCPTLTTRDKLAMVNPAFLAKYYGTGDNVGSVDEPAATIRTKDCLTKVQPVWLDKTYGGKENHQSVDQPAGAIVTNDKHQLVQTEWIDRNFSGGGQTSSVEEPAGSILQVPKLNKVTTKPFILGTSFDNAGKSVEDPAPTLLASRRHHYIVNPSHGGCNTSTEAPCPVIVARQDKAPLYLTQAIPGFIGVDLDNFFTKLDLALLNEWFEIETTYGPQIEKSIRVKIIEFMLMYGIADIKMRMLKVSELLPIQGFPKDYKLFGNQSDQKKFIGNSVVPHVVKSWCEAMAGKLRDIRLQAA